MKIIVLVFCVTFVYGQNERVSQLRCQQYNNFLQSNNICHQLNILKEIQQGDYPYLGAIGYGRQNGEVDWVCAGVLISEYFVVTTAHCVSRQNRPNASIFVRFNTLDITLPNLQTENTFSVAEIIQHPNYYAEGFVDDIALVRLSEPVQFNEFIQPACLHYYYEEELPRYKLVGYNTRRDKSGRRLLAHDVTEVVEGEKCVQEWKDLDLITQFCHKETEISCGLISGSPFIYTNNKNPCVQYMVGITDWRRTNCLGNLAVNVRITAYVEWIENIVWPKEIM